MKHLLVLHSCSEMLGLGIRPLDAPGADRLACFPLGRRLANELLSSVEQMLPASQWHLLGRLVVATGPGGFTATRLTVVLARTLAQQLSIPLHGVSGFQLAGVRLGLDAPTWLCQDLPGRGRVAGLYGPDSAALGSVREFQPPRLFATGCSLPPGPQLSGQPLLPADLETMLALGIEAEQRRLAGPWPEVLPIYPTSPVADR
ncbi:MAG: tRNA (adenosine(37)-N6)-threonylcarbamoyltransferase complex dimerization subunit type 1 TsaB [Cyanobacteriota bacterium]|nr:tRNA (adenosine(37)-N6)-threonylcarbamoyltransferase complex dimerization subunit type 1 TsaB [Cyanobacteriota bacterium]